MLLPVLRIIQKNRIGKCSHETNQVVFFQVGELNAIHKAWIEGGALVDVESVMLYHMAGQTHASIMKVIGGEFNIAQAGHPELQRIGRIAGHLGAILGDQNMAIFIQFKNPAAGA